MYEQPKSRMELRELQENRREFDYTSFKHLNPTRLENPTKHQHQHHHRRKVPQSLDNSFNLRV